MRSTRGLYSDVNFRTGFKFDTSQDSGFYLPIELGWEPLLGAARLPGHYKLGFGYDTSSNYKDFGNVLAAAAVPGYATKTRTGNSQYWALADQMLVRNGDGDKSGLVALAGLIKNDGNNTQYESQYFLGLLDRGFWAARPDDGIGLLATYVAISGRLSNVEAAEQAVDLPLSNNATRHSVSRADPGRPTTTSMSRAASISSRISNMSSGRTLNRNIPDAAVLRLQGARFVSE